MLSVSSKSFAASAWKPFSLDIHADSELRKCYVIGKVFPTHKCKIIFSLLITFRPIMLLSYFYSTYHLLTLEYEFIYLYCLSTPLESKLHQRNDFFFAHRSLSSA